MGASKAAYKHRLINEVEHNALICCFYDILNRYEKTLDPVFSQVMGDFEVAYNNLLDTRKAALQQTPVFGVNIRDYELRQEVPKWGLSIPPGSTPPIPIPRSKWGVKNREIENWNFDHLTWYRTKI